MYSCAHFVIEIDEKSSHNGGFNTIIVANFLGHPVGL